MNMVHGEQFFPQVDLAGVDNDENNIDKSVDNGTKVVVLSRSSDYGSQPFVKRLVTTVLGERHTNMVSELTKGRIEKSSKSQSHRTSNGYCDIVSLSILFGMWRIVDIIFGYLDAYSLENCEQASDLWRDYIKDQKVWKRNVQTSAKCSPNLVAQNGWSKFLQSSALSHSLEVYKHTYWKMTNLSQIWSLAPRSMTEIKNHFQRSGSIVWKFLPSQRAVSVYNSGKGFTVKIHDQQTYRFRGAHKELSGTVKKDTLCLDATDNRIVVGGMLSQKVWIFRVEEIQLEPVDSYFDRFVIYMINSGATSRLLVSINKFINAESGVSKVQLHPSDSDKLAVLLPLNQTVEIWSIDQRTRLQHFAVTSDSCYLMWQRNNILLTVPLFSGVLMTFDTNTGEVKKPVVGNIRRIDAVAVYENLCATGETQTVRLWSLSQCKSLVSWTASKTFITALLLNDTMVISGSSAGIVKLWDLKTLLKKDAAVITPLRKISMKGVLHYPIKDIFQFSYTDLVIVAKYEANRKKDKVKVVEVYRKNR